MEDISKLLNANTKEERLDNLIKVMKSVPYVERKEQVNEHIHTKFSFSPYSPTYAVYMSYMEGLDIVGIVDHDNFAGAEEFYEAGKIARIKTSFGYELRVNYKDTPFENKSINNPDQKGVAYMLFHGVPINKQTEISKFSSIIISERMKRNALMVENLNRIFSKYSISIDLEKDVIPLSYYVDGGTVTERHLLSALSKKLLEKYNGIIGVSQFFKDNFSLNFCYNGINDSLHEEYYLIGKLKANFMKEFYIPADKELKTVKEATLFARSINAIPCYSYLGDVETCVTGDKASQKFEDEYLDDLIKYVTKEVDIRAVTYAPSRNSKTQLERFRNLCRKYNLFEVCGDDVNSLGQSFIIKQLENNEYKYLVDNGYTIHAHEQLVSNNDEMSFENKVITKYYEDVNERAKYFRSLVK